MLILGMLVVPHILIFLSVNSGGGWFLSHIIVKEGEGRRAREFIFPCRKWFDGGFDDKKIERIISPGPLPADEEGQQIKINQPFRLI